MAGLVGTMQWQGNVLPLSLARACQRGPDAQSGWCSGDGRCWLAGQPITSHCERFTLVFNGQIVNHQQVRHGLRFQGWRGNSDSETLVEGLAQRGPAIVLELHGMFAFAGYDNEKEQLLLARDRLGIKPLYLSWLPYGLQFACERRALPGADQLEAQTISQVLAFGHDRTSATFPSPDSTGIVSLPTGMVVRINHSRPHDPVRYWPPQPRPDWTPLPIRNVLRARTFLRQQLEETVAQQLVADGTVTCLLSSGLNSGVLAALAGSLQTDGIDTVTVSLPGMPADNIHAARTLAAQCGSRHHELVIEENQALAWVEQGIASLDSPNVGGLKSTLIARAVAAEGIQVALSGLGADEIFGGTPSHRLMPWIRGLRWLPGPVRQSLLQNLAPHLAKRLVGLPDWDRWHLGLALHRWASDGNLAAAGSEPLQWSEPPPQRITQAWGQTCWAELFGTTEPMLLRDASSVGLACGLELRMPYLDHRIVEIALRMPQRFQKPGEGLLRHTCDDLLPPRYGEVLGQDSSLPMAAWMRGPLRDLCRSRLEGLQASGWLNPAWLAGQWQAFEAGQLHWSRAWSLVVLGAFACSQPDP